MGNTASLLLIRYTFILKTINDTMYKLIELLFFVCGLVSKVAYRVSMVKGEIPLLLDS